jgi:hypothetical protein
MIYLREAAGPTQGRSEVWADRETCFCSFGTEPPRPALRPS